MIAQLLPALPADAPAAHATSRLAVPPADHTDFASLLGLEEAIAVAEPAGDGTESTGLLLSPELEAAFEEPAETTGEPLAPPQDGILDPALLTASRPLGETNGADALTDLPLAGPEGADRTEPAGNDPGLPIPASAKGQLVEGDSPADVGPAEDAAAPVKTARRISRGDIMSAAFSVMERPAARQEQPAPMDAAPDTAGPKELAEAAAPQPADPVAAEPSAPSRPLSVALPTAPAVPPTDAPADRESTSQSEVFPLKEVQASAPSAPLRQADDVATRPAAAAITAPAAQGQAAQQGPTADAPSLTGEAFSPEAASEHAEVQPGFEPASARSEAQPVSPQPAQALASARFRSPLARSVATQLSGASLEEGSVTIRLRPQGMGVIEIEIARGAQGQMEIAMRVQNPMVLDALRTERSALSDLLAGSGARSDNLDLGLFQPGGEGRDSGRENREERAAPSPAMLSSIAAGEDLPTASQVLPASGVQGSSLTDIIA